jgi:hypothetical protein
LGLLFCEKAFALVEVFVPFDSKEPRRSLMRRESHKQTPDKMQTNRNGDCAPFVPGRMQTAARTPTPMKKKPTLVGTGLPVTFMAQFILCLSGRLS